MPILPNNKISKSLTCFNTIQSNMIHESIHRTKQNIVHIMQVIALHRSNYVNNMKNNVR